MDCNGACHAIKKTLEGPLRHSSKALTTEPASEILIQPGMAHTSKFKASLSYITSLRPAWVTE